MSETKLSWVVVDRIARDLGVEAPARFKWRQRQPPVPPKWRIAITQELMRRGILIALSDFDTLEQTPGRIAA